jgi:aspartyl/asparaginyl beta-hydroxylase (cupin superfamily)
MFSLLKPRTQIPPHTGVTNVRLVVHLPLIVPEGAAFRVGNEVREWVPGRPGSSTTPSSTRR